MTVEELIKELEKLPQDMQVQFRISKLNDCGFYICDNYNIEYVLIVDNIVTLE